MNSNVCRLTAIAVLAVSLGRASYAQFTTPLWRPRVESLEQVKAHAGFPVLTPRLPSKEITLLKSEIVWVPRDKTMFPESPSRKAVALFYHYRGVEIAILEAHQVVDPRNGRKNNANTNIYELVGRGFFFGRTPVGTYFRFKTFGSTDVGIVGRWPKLTERQYVSAVETLLKSLK